MVKKLKYLLFFIPFIFLTDVNASTIGGIEADSPNYAVITSNYNNIAVRLWTENIFGTDIVDYGTVVNDYVYVTACTDMPTLGYSYVPFYNSTTGSTASATDIRYAANLTSKSCTFNTGVQGKVAYIKFRLISDLLNVPVSGNNTWLYNDYVTFYIGTNRVFSFSIQNIIALDDDIDIYSNDFDTTLLEQQNQQIINNQNTNTNSIINNQNQNTQSEINSQKVCNNYGINYATISGNLNTNGGVSNDSNQAVSDFIFIENAEITLLDRASKWNNLMCFYDKNQVKTQCYTQYDFNINDNIPIPANSFYFRYTVIKTEGKPQYNICINGNQALSNDINHLNDTLNSEATPNTNQDISDMENMVASDTPISDLITMPLTLINAYINGLNSTCSPVNLGNLYGTNLIIPCIDIPSKIGNDLWGKIDVICCIFMCYEIGMLFITAFDGITSLRDDFEGLYQPRHADVGYQPKHGGGN